ncbi:uncharacterized protein LOC126743934 isoform X2 [Anthonomus grandis grandis]|uniref:uncharacterized protein LOC126743934 isoform X2 n=1 Tax=Anthonomus grandis grandis TaxID=2921223 RepID=UPI0021656194|nr:uncharacterized protein LOC126743934 isoform X2 [Anthonomus grandis grandis]
MKKYGQIHAMKDVEVMVPITAKVHDAVRLQCIFDLEGEPLYTVKWFKRGMEFFRYIPREDPKMQIFSIPGVNIDLSRSSQDQIVMLDVAQETTGRYRCEVSTDAPNFETKSASSFLYVVEVPDSGPTLGIERDKTGLSNTIRANCTTPPAYPSMNVTWYINGVQVPESRRNLVSLDPLGQHYKNRYTPHMTVSHVEKEVDFDLYQLNSIKIQCVATLFNLYRSADVRYLEIEGKQHWTAPEKIEANQMIKSGASSTFKLTATCIVIWIYSTVYF